MKISEFIQRLPALYYSALEPGGPSYYLEGNPGTAKTSAFMQFPKLMKRIDPGAKFAMGYINGGNFTLMTAMGFMVWDKDDKGRTLSEFALPYWYYVVDDRGKRAKQTLDEFDGGILLVDEYDKLGMDEKKIVGEAALSKILGNHALPEGWVVMFAGNLLSNKSGGTRDLRHTIMRRITLGVTEDPDGWCEWARGAGLLPEVILFAEENPQLLYEPQPADDRPSCSPRTLHQCDIHLQSLMQSFGTDVIPTDALTQEEIKGGIGAPACAQLVKTINLGQQCPNFSDILADPMTAMLPSKPDAQRLTSYKVAVQTTVENAPTVMKYISRLPGEHQIMFARMAIQRNFKLTFQKDFAAFCGRHAQLIAILNKYKVEG